MVKEEIVPANLQVFQHVSKVDFSDTFAITNHEDSLQEIAMKVFGEAPPFVRFLFRLRNALVKFIGLKASLPPDYNVRFQPGGYVGFFKIYDILENEIILGADDAHLNFRASIFNSREDAYNIKVTTVVQFNNLTGKIYMFVVKPFHRLVVKQMLKNACTKD